MKICLVCSRELDDGNTICPVCGFDWSADRESYPTLTIVQKPELSIEAKKNQKLQRKTLEKDPVQKMGTANRTNDDDYYSELLNKLNKRENELPRGEILGQGQCGKDVFWKIYESGILTLDGAGKMNDYGSIFNKPPWNKWIKNIWRVEVGNGVVSVGKMAFAKAKKLEFVKLPETLYEINELAFWGCVSLNTIKIPDSVGKIGSQAFWGCHNLYNVYLPHRRTKIECGAFGLCKSLKRIELPYDLKKIPRLMFLECESLQSIDISSSVEKIECGAFEKCKSLQVVRIPDVTRVEEGAFKDCPAELHRYRIRRRVRSR